VDKPYILQIDKNIVLVEIGRVVEEGEEDHQITFHV
jgi:hypothetical protein